MRRRIGAVFALAAALAMVATLVACAGPQGKSDASVNSGSLAAAEKSLEAGNYQGTLVMAYENRLSISGADGDMEFATNSQTDYALGETDEMCLDDIVSVAYHIEGDNKVVDKMSLVEHIEAPLEFAGVLVDSDDESLTLSSKGSTITFQMDSDTYCVGDLSQGDEIELTYLGNLTEYPYASVVAVVKEVEQPQTITVRGMVSELTGGTLLLGIDSAYAYRFALTGNTSIKGAANDIKVGDRVDITFKGSIKSVPEALEVNIVTQGEARAYVINGKIADVKQDSLTLETDKAKYVFGVNSSTKLNGDKPAKGYNAEVTYTGALADSPQAIVVYSVKSAKDVKAKNKATNKQTAKSSSSSAKKAESQSEKAEKQDGQTSTQGAQKQSEAAAPVQQPETPSATEPESKPEPTPESKASEPAPSPASEWAEPAPTPGPDGTEPGPEPTPDPEGTEQEPTPDPEGTEQEPTPDPEGTEPGPEQPPAPEGGEPEPTPDSESTNQEPEPAPEPEADQQEPEPAPEPEAKQQEPEPAPEPEATEQEPEPEPDKKVSGKGTFVKGSEQEKTIVVEIGGKKLTLTIDGDTQLPSGYVPEAGDIVKVTYGSNSMTLKSMKLEKKADDSKG